MYNLNIEYDVNLKHYHTFGLDVQAKAFGVFTTVDALTQLLNLAGSHENKMILGGGSNILFTKNYDGWILQNKLKGIELVHQDEDYVYVKAGAGENWHAFVMQCIEQGFGGLENLSLIPGNVGASPMQNIGAYGVELKDVFYALEAFHMQENYLQTFHYDDCAFGYRESVFKRALKDQFVICHVTFRLRKKPILNTSYGAIEQELQAMHITNPTMQDVSNAVIRIRQSKLPDPAKVGNAGSFFKNPEISSEQFSALAKAYPNMPGYPTKPGFTKVPAGWLIEQCGYKGYRNGDAGVHPLQGLVLVNYGHATGKEIFDLSQTVMDMVLERFGVLLEREVYVV